MEKNNKEEKKKTGKAEKEKRNPIKIAKIEYSEKELSQCMASVIELHYGILSETEVNYGAKE